MIHKLQAISRSANKKVDMTDHWSAMPPEILELISDRLSLADLFTFRSVCRSWRLSPSGRLDISKFKKDSTWLMFYDVSDDEGKEYCYMYNTSHPTPCTFRVPGLKGAIILESKLGWFLAHCDGHLFFFNPFSLEKMEVAHYPLAPNQFYTSRGAPTDPRCTVYVLSRMNNSKFEVCYRGIKDTNWSIKQSFNINEQDGISKTVIDFVACCCRMDHCWSLCTCCCKDKIVFTLRGPGDRRSYHYYCLNKKVSGKIGSDSGGDHLATDLYTEMQVKHGSNWLKKFGGVEVSIASYSCNPRVGVGSIARTWAIRTDGHCRESTLKAAWIEPWFALKRLDTTTPMYHRALRRFSLKIPAISFSPFSLLASMLCF